MDLLGSGKKNTKIYKAEHIPTGKYYALKEVEAKTLEKLNEYKVSKSPIVSNPFAYIGRSRATFQGAKPPKCPLVLWLLLL